MFSKLAGAVALAVASIQATAADLSAGGYHLVRVDGGLVRGLGDGTYGQLGSSPAGSPATIVGLSAITDVAAGGFTTLALKNDGTVWFLGETTLQHTTPHGTPAPVAAPVQVTGLAAIDAIAAGHRHFLALDVDTGNLHAWGHNGSGQIGNGGRQDADTPAVVLTGVASMSAGDGFSLAVKTDGTLWAWGRNAHGQLGLGDTADRSSPVQVPGITNAASVAAGGQHALILLTDNTVLATGNNSHGQLGFGSTTATTTPITVPGLSGVTAVSAGYFHSAAVGPGSQVRVWGRNFEGQCGGGNASPVSYTSPQALAGLSGTPAGVDCGYHFTVVELTDGSFAGTGSNSDGQLDGISVADQDDSRKVLYPQAVPLTPATAPPGVILSTGFTGRTVSGKTAASIAWTIVGVADPGDLTAVDESPTSPAFAGLFDTADSTGHFAPDKNIGNEGPWSVTIPLVLTTSGIRIANVVLDWQHFDNSGEFQIVSRSADWTVSITGSSSGLIDSITASGVNGISGLETLSFPAPLTLTNAETYTMKIFVSSPDADGNNTGLDALTVNGASGEAVSIPVTNFSFEADENTSSDGGFASGERRDFGGELTGWISQSGSDMTAAVGWKDIIPSELHPSPPAGGQESQALSLITGGSVLNTTGTAWSSLAAGDTLILTTSLGMRGAAAAGLNWNEESFFGLTDADADLGTVEPSDTVAHSGLIANNPATGTQFGDGTFTNVSFSHTVEAADLVRPGNIGILIAASGSGGSSSTFNQSFFDHVRLTRITPPADDFDAYISNPAFGLDPNEQGFTDDPDQDGLMNGIEAWFGTHPGEFNAGLTGPATDGTVSSFSHPRNETPPSDLSGFYQWSLDLDDWYAGDGVDGPVGGPTVTISPSPLATSTTVTATASEALKQLYLRAGVVRE